MSFVALLNLFFLCGTTKEGFRQIVHAAFIRVMEINGDFGCHLALKMTKKSSLHDLSSVSHDHFIWEAEWNLSFSLKIYAIH